MSSLIEQAAERLEQLRRAGITIPEIESPPNALHDDATSPTLPPSRASSASTSAQSFPPTAASPRPAAPQDHSDGPDSQLPQSRRVDIDLTMVSASGIVTPISPRSHIADQYRVIKRPLIANAMGRGAATVKHGNLIMVTSALPGEGKSFTSVNLAMSIAAELDHTVMLVDADVARPSIPRMLGLPPGPGLLDLLGGKTDMASVLLRTNVDKLTILPSGSPHARATELLASDAMSQLLSDMATRYPDRIIIFDSPPLLLTTEARVLASHMGQIVMVVHADRTLQSTVRQALNAIEACPLKLMVLNKTRTNAGGSYGESYGYGYGYGYGYTADPTQGSKPGAAGPADPSRGA
jgi:exopolysaccharide/PEP-CTERM locus tyrosine autokinase